MCLLLAVLTALTTLLSIAAGPGDAQTCPCTIWPGTAVPAIASDPDTAPVEVGVKFRSDVAGFITGIRFYKGSLNTGTHTGSLWSATGTLLGRSTFTNETGSGWQQVTLATPVAITANTIYVASYFAPVGRYSVNEPFFASTGVDNPPLHAVANSVSANGVYRYSSSPIFPNQTFNTSNYWVDVVFATTSSDTTPPTVTSVSPVNAATGVAGTVNVTATFSEAMNPASLSTSTFELRDQGGALVPGAVTYNATTRVATLNPTPTLLAGISYTATIRGGTNGAKDAAGNPLAADFVWFFKRSGTDTRPPVVTSVSPVDGAANVVTTTTLSATFDEAMTASTIAVGTFELRDAADALVPRTVSYDPNTRVATLTPTSALVPGTTYRATVLGGTTGVKDLAGIALAANRTWTFTTAGTAPDTTPPTVTASTPPNGAVGVSAVTTVTATFSERINPATISSDTFQLRAPGNTLVPASVSYNDPTRVATLTPTGPLAAGTAYSASVLGGGTGVKDLAGNPLAATVTWSFTTAGGGGGGDTTPPTVTAVSPPGGAVGVDPVSAVTATFSEPMDPVTIGGSTFQLRDPGNTLVPASVAYSTSTRIATLTPAGPLNASTAYTATVSGGTGGVKDLAGNPLAANHVWSFTTAGPAPCAANPIVCENQKPGNPSGEWDIAGAGDPSIQGFATELSVNRGETVRFKIDTDATSYRLDIYRMGYYAGNGARLVATVNPTVAPQNQPPCLTASATGLIDCGNWAESASWAVPPDATSGIYFAKLVRQAGGAGSSHIVFIVRDDAGQAPILFQTSDTTWQAYNQYGGNSLYVGGPGVSPGRAFKVSYNRPFTTRGTSPEDWLFNAEYPMVRWLEANGFHVSYWTGADTDRLGTQLPQHRLFLSVGHDEYWSGAQRANVEAARNAGVHLAFFSGNEIFWKTRWENSIDGSNAPYRTLVSYKETHANSKIDPLPNVWTGTWRDPRFSPPADGGRPENALTGTIFTVNAPASPSSAITVPEADGKMRFWRNTAIATLAAGTTATLTSGTLGYEWDEDLQNGVRPAGLFRLSSTTSDVAQKLQDLGSTYGPGTATHSMTLYRHASGALVFGAGTVQWSWGLDSNHDRGNAAADARMQQAVVNLFADMQVQPATLQAGLVAASASADATAPTSTITSPEPGATLQAGQPTTIQGTASDTAGGRVAAVEVSVDNGVTWQPASGRATWSFSWTPGNGTATIRSRAVDDSGNLESPAAGVTVTVGGGQACPCTLWSSATVPSVVSDSDTSAVELGVKFQVDVPGVINGIRFYKGSANTGTHIGNLWTSAGQLLGSVTFTSETASGWQQATFSTPVVVAAGTTYIASYHTNVGRYAADGNYFASTGVDSGPVHALSNAVTPNGLYRYGAASAFPNQTFNATNYWVDVSFTPTTSPPPDTTAPTIASFSPPNGGAGISPSAAIAVRFSEPMNPATVSTNAIQLRTAGNVLVNATVTYNSTTWTGTLTPVEALATSAHYTVTVLGGSTDPRVKDVAGNALASTATWSFSTAAGSIPPVEGPGGPILVVTTSQDRFSKYYTEILRAEGLHLFASADISTVTPAMLAAYDVVILSDMLLAPSQVTMLTDWVTSGGNLIAMHPDKQLAPLLGLTDAGTTLSNAYLLVDTSAPPGAGIVGQTIQYKGTADQYALNGATAVATLYSTATTATTSPAVSLRSIGVLGGQAAAVTYDLARSVVAMRQGNPAWAGQERDGVTPVRPDDLFFGNATGDPQPDWINLDKVAIPQADEQQRLLANLIVHMNVDRKPLPRFWYFPRDLKAVVVMTGDDHANGGTAGRFDQYDAMSPANCSVENWECVRGTSYIYINPSMTDAAAAQYNARGFEIALHVNTGCADWTPSSLAVFYADQLADFQATYPSLPAPSTNRTHCIVWSDWASQAKVEVAHNIGLDTNYYYWPPTWALDRPGFFTGSGMPMRFADTDGTLIDIYQATSQMTDESGQSFPFTINSLLDRALGPEGYFGAFVANMHTDAVESSGSDAIVTSALARSVPVVSARQMLDWLDGRNSSSFAGLGWDGTRLSFTVLVGQGANGLQVMLPATSSAGALASVTRDGLAVPVVMRTIKGISWGTFPAAPGLYQAVYAPQ